nr:adenosylmethionine--8-amino-7-oxononanoate transaminase [uncultured Holophaga sp.]
MTPRLPSDWSERLAFDMAHVWHPFTQMKEHLDTPPLPVVGAEGVDLILEDGRRVLDGISSWWCNVHGHGHPRILGALERQAAKLDHVMFAGFTHEPALELVARLRPRLPDSLRRCFFSDNGSTAIEVALKMAFQAQIQQGRAGRVRFGALREGYHGDTLGAVGVGELDNWLTGIFRPLLLHCDRFQVPEDPRRELRSVPGPDLDAARQGVRAYFEAHGETMAAFVAEPLVQGAGGMRFWAPELLREIRHQCDRFGVYLILDEVMTGFGRTGSFLALDQCGVVPDFLCLSKGLTNGTLPLSLTWTTDDVYEHFWGDYTQWRTFFHGHTFTANPLACAVACASLAIFDDEPVMARAQALAEALREAWGSLDGLPSVRRARTLGCIAACQIVDPATGLPHPVEARFGWKFHRKALDHGLLVRPMGDCLYLMPPLATPVSRIREAVEALGGLLA